MVPAVRAREAKFYQMRASKPVGVCKYSQRGVYTGNDGTHEEQQNWSTILSLRQTCKLNADLFFSSLGEI